MKKSLAIFLAGSSVVVALGLGTLAGYVFKNIKINSLAQKEVEEIIDESSVTIDEIVEVGEQNLAEDKLEIPRFVECYIKTEYDNKEKKLTFKMVDANNEIITGSGYGIKLLSKDNGGQSLLDYQKGIASIDLMITEYLKTNEGADEMVTYTMDNGKEVEISKLDYLYLNKQTAVDGYQMVVNNADTTLYADEDLDGIIEVPNVEQGSYVTCYVGATEMAEEGSNHQAQSVSTKEINYSPVSYAFEDEAAAPVEKKVDTKIEDKVSKYNAADDTAGDRNGGKEVTLTKKEETTPKTENTTQSDSKKEKKAEAVVVASLNAYASGSASVDHSYNDADNNYVVEGISCEAKNIVLFPTETGSSYTVKLSNKGYLPTPNVSCDNESFSVSITSVGNIKIEATGKDQQEGIITVKTTVPGDSDAEISMELKVTLVAGTTTLRDTQGHALFVDEKLSQRASISDFEANTTYYFNSASDDVDTEDPATIGAKVTSSSSNSSSNTSGEQQSQATGSIATGLVTHSSGSAYSSLNGTTGIDVSKYQGNINWSVTADYIGYAFIRCGGRYRNVQEDGTTLYEDPNFYTNMSGAKSAGVTVGVYFYSTATTVEQAVEEASLAVAMTNRAGGCSLPIFFDQEDSKLKSLSGTKKAALANAFCQTVRSAGYNAGVYASANWLTGIKSGGGTFDSGTYIWVAQYADTVKDYSGNYHIWQYSCKGVVPGISGGVDVNRSYF